MLNGTEIMECISIYLSICDENELTARIFIQNKRMAQKALNWLNTENVATHTFGSAAA